MQLENKFTIDAPIEKAWTALNTPQTIAPCFPGATLTEYEGDSFTGTVKVKLGPISLTYKGKGTYKERDDANHRVVIDATGRDSRGNGTAEATVVGTMVADGPDKTAVTMVTDMKITGRPAQFGRGVISDVADKIIGQFASCVASKLQAEEAPAQETGVESVEETAQVPATVSAAGAAAGAAATNGSAASGPAVSSAPAVPSGSELPATTPAVPPTTTPAPTSTPTSTAPMKSEIDAIDLLDTAGAPVLKRLAPVLGGGVLLLLIVLLVRRIRS
ncbi:MAG TPA: SRPBCC family protein [Pseudonocardia sp.]